MSETLIIVGPDYSNFVRCVSLCCLEKRVAYELRSPDRRLKEINPFQRVPVLEYQGRVIFETAAIIRFIDRAFDGPSLSPQDPETLAWMDQWISAAVCYFDSAIIRRYVLEYAFPKGEDGVVRGDVVAEAEQDINSYLEIMSRALLQYPFFSGDRPGIADYLIVPMLDYLANGIVPSNLVDDYPVVRRYLNGMLQRPSCQQLLGLPVL